MPGSYRLAQVNVGRFRAPIDSPLMEGFRARLVPVNALADQSPGFVWRLQTDAGDATAIRPYEGDDLMAINLSVWETLESLRQFVYKSHHVESLRNKVEDRGGVGLPGGVELGLAVGGGWDREGG